MNYLKKINIRIGIFLSIFCLASCSKWLDIQPISNTKEEILFHSENGFREALNGVYVQMQAGLYGDDLTMSFLSILSQNYEISFEHIYYNEASYNYTQTGVRPTVDQIWNKMYTAIASTNNILKNVEIHRNIFTDNQYQLIKGQALGLRAFLHFDLLRLFGAVPMANNMAKTAMPYVLDYNRKVTPSSSVLQAATLCLKDLDEAEALLNNDASSKLFGKMVFTLSTKYTMNYWAVIALKARIYLYMGNKAKALEYAKKIIDSKFFDFITAAGVSEDKLFSPEHIFSLEVTKLKETASAFFNLAGNNNTDANSINNIKLFTYDENILDLYEVNNGGSTDFRFLYLFEKSNGNSYSTKFSFGPNQIAKAKEANIMPLIRLSEVYYIAAECEPELSKAQEYLNTVIENRGLNKLKPVLNKNILQEEILKEYQKEFYAEGQLFFYYKRLGIVPIPQAKANTTLATYILPIPLSEIEFGNRVNNN